MVYLKELYNQMYREHQAVFAKLESIENGIVEAGKLLRKTILGGNKILICGNGGSAADAQHFAAELVGRFSRERCALPAIALTTNSSIISAIANDYDFDRIFARQVEALGSKGDVLVGVSTSGRSINVLRAVESARGKSLKTIGLLGADGGSIRQTVDLPLIVPSAAIAHIQEAHIFILHVWCGMIEAVHHSPS